MIACLMTNPRCSTDGKGAVGEEITLEIALGLLDLVEHAVRRAAQNVAAALAERAAIASSARA